MRKLGNWALRKRVLSEKSSQTGISPQQNFNTFSNFGS